MKNRLIYIILLISFYSCATQNYVRTKTINLQHEKGRIVVEDEKYRLYLDVNQVQQYFEDKPIRSEEDEKLLLLLKSNNDTLIIKNPTNNLSLKEDNQVAIFPVLYDFLKKGNCSIIKKQDSMYVKKMRVISVKDNFVGHQVNFIIDKDLYLSCVFSLGE